MGAAPSPPVSVGMGRLPSIETVSIGKFKNYFTRIPAVAAVRAPSVVGRYHIRAIPRWLGLMLQAREKPKIYEPLMRVSTTKKSSRL